MNASALFLSAFTVERYIAICHPMKAQVGSRRPPEYPSHLLPVSVHLHPQQSQEDHPLLLDIRCVLQLPLAGSGSHQDQLHHGLRKGKPCPHTASQSSPFIQVPKCTFRLARDSTMHFVMFSIDITLFYLIPLVLSVVLYTLISIMLLFNGPRTFNDGTSRNRARLQVRREERGEFRFVRFLC